MIRLHAHVRSAWRGEAGGYLRAALVAGVFALLLLVVLTTTGCESFCLISSPSSMLGELYNVVVRSIIYGGGSFPAETAVSTQLPGARVTHQLSVSENQAGAPGTADCLYWPPEGATNFVFGDAPANPNGPAPFVFEDLPLRQFVEVSFNLPTLPPGQTSMQAVETFQCDPGVGSPSIAVYTTEIGAGGVGPTAPAPMALPADPALPEIQATGPVTAWTLMQWVDPPPNEPFTTDTCQQLLDAGRRSDVFLAVRLPLPAHPANESAPVGVSMDPASPPNVIVMGYGQGTVFTGTLAMQPARGTQLASLLPAAPGSTWFAFGLDPSTPATCPEGIDLPAAQWGAKFEGDVYFGNLPNNCEDCVLPFYACYEGLISPEEVDGMGVASVAQDGVTCAGPNNFVVGFSEWLLEVSTNTEITYTQPITLHHGVAIENGLGPQTVTVSYAGTLPVQWHLYGGDWVGPDLGDPLPPTFTVTDWKDLWLISDPTPAGAPSGAHTLAFTVTTEMTPTSRWIADNLWLGPWTPPPPAPCGALANLQVAGTGAAPGEALQLIATASPITATTPYSYTWRSEGQPTAMHTFRYYTDTVTYTWPEAGAYTVTVAVENCGGVRTATQTVRVGEQEEKIFVPFAKKE